jgi:hypothetical protein
MGQLRLTARRTSKGDEIKRGDYPSPLPRRAARSHSAHPFLRHYLLFVSAYFVQEALIVVVVAAQLVVVAALIVVDEDIVLALVVEFLTGGGLNPCRLEKLWKI